ncbi:16S rRNA (uracil(1498)-N(3))-methyltransferase [Fertoebacter nigrum]|uniref:Ribosomal RNA small subunit methyltransferase E n=1 Tax=Fertoeibacter niger TaxID=2656921 RepID=A0A8X8GW95_9RHOB|nr:16S rRNA (uracil(1498)-N(3))-methyltransferase [Fertoeibacter niger]NUB44277.1 16S rRNA (uracil(1498)-N(3))-methyltransferase [Fertoeibacter niger]
MADAKIRLFVDHPLAAGQPVPLTQDQAHYLFGVMRLGPGAAVLLFNGRDGEWRAVVAEAGKRGGMLVCETQTAPLCPPPDLWLLFAPIKKARTDFIVEKATEMGVARIMPVQTQHTNADRIRQDRLQAHAMEAAEQCGATAVPEVADLAPLDRVLATWPAERRLMWADEALAGRPFAQTGDIAGAGGSSALTGDIAGGQRGDPSGLTSGFGEPRGPWAVLIGPEGGFSAPEQARLRAMPQIVPVRLGPRILRADTAAVAALTLWQMTLGDWI